MFDLKMSIRPLQKAQTLMHSAQQPYLCVCKKIVHIYAN